MDLRTARQRALAAHPGSPLITDRTQGRVELSHATFDNWVTKTVNFLRLEAEVGEGEPVSVDLPLHWMTAVWCVSVWEAGCGLSLGTDGDLRVGGESPDVFVGADPFGMAAPPAGITAQWAFPGDARGMPDALALPPAQVGSVLGTTPEGLAVAAAGYAEARGLSSGGRLHVQRLTADLDGVLGLVGAALAVDAAVVYGPADWEAVTATA